MRAAEVSAARSVAKVKTASVPLSAALEQPTAAAHSSIILMRFLRFSRCAMLLRAFLVAVADGGIAGRSNEALFGGGGGPKSCGGAETF